ncbi:MAG: efflux RND transporter permease subunit [Pseudomonadota bacterium]|nr:efflux RND transporter permease subunit [Pseudomonadota bacterium]
MFNALIRLSLQNRLFVLVVAAVVLAWGGWTAARLPVDVFPDLNRPTVTLLTEAGGLSPEEVELLVTLPIETSMNGAPGVERVRSQSAVGLSVVWVEFDWDVDIYRARQQVAERTAQVAESLPEGVVPTMGPVSSIMGEILLIGVVSPEGTVPGPELRSLADWTLRPRLLSIGGISQVIAIGGGVEQLHVEVHPDRLAQRGLTLGEVREAAAGAQGSTTGGFLEQQSQEYVVRNLARTADPAAIGDTVVALKDGVPVTLADVADVRRGVGTMRGDAGVNGRPAVILSVQKQPGTDTIMLTEQVEHALDELRRGLPPGVDVVPLFRQADFIEASVANVEEALRDGAILVTIILVLFLLNVRTTAITLTAIPLSMVVAALALQAFGLTINTMTLGGLAVAIGELVDDAIVDVENVYRRLRENRALPTPRPPLRVILDASVEVRSSIVFSTILVILVFIPLFALSGIEGRLFAPLGIAYIASILASMVVSLTVTPVLASYLLPRMTQAKEHADGWLVRKLKGLDRRALVWALPRPKTVMFAVAAAVLLAAASVPFLGTSFLPPFNEGTATINLLATPGTSLTESDKLGSLAERLLLEVPEVKSTGRRTGRAEMDEHAEGVHYTEIDVDFERPTDEDPGRPRDEVLADIRAKLARIPGVVTNIGQPISHRLDHLLSGVRAQIAIKVFGPDLATLRGEAARIEERLAPIPGLVDLQVERQVLIPQVQVRIDRDAARRFGVAPGHLAEDLETALGGVRVGQVLDGVRSLDLVTRYAPEWRGDIDRIGIAPVSLEDGRAVTLGQLAEVSPGTGPNQVVHEDGQRRIAISANTAGRDVGSVVGDIQAALDGIALPTGYYWTIGGQFESQQSASRTIGLLSLLSLAGMYAVLYAHFRSHALTLQVLLNIPLALIGSVAAIWISGQPLSVATLVGFITLCGIASRNTILMISHYIHLVRHEGESFGPEMVIRGSLERLVPVAMTALCAGIALIPLAFAGGTPGKEILTPVAQVILGGLLSSTLLDMVVTPTVFLRYGGNALRSLVAGSEVTDPLEAS